MALKITMNKIIGKNNASQIYAVCNKMINTLTNA